MTVKECYEIIGGDFEDVLERLGQEELILKFAVKFLSDKNYELLSRSMKERNYKEAFGAVHTLKGGCQNMSFTRLCNSTQVVTEALRAGEYEKAAEYMQQLETDYMLTVNTIRQLQAE